MPTSINRTVLMSDARHFSAEQAINPYYFDSHADIAQAQKEHDSIRLALESVGVTVITTPSPEDSQDGVYTANWALVRGNKAVLSRLPDVRKSEEKWAREVLNNLGKEVIDVPDGLRFSGQGDALACGPYLFCGKGYRSDEDAQIFAADALGYTRVQLQTIPQLNNEGMPVTNPVSGWEDSFFYDIDLALSIIQHPSENRPGLIAYCPDAFTDESCQKIKQLISDGSIEAIEVTFEEAEKAFACNLVSTGSAVVMSAEAPKLKAELEKRNITVVTPVIHELSKGGGYIRCTSLCLD